MRFAVRDDVEQARRTRAPAPVVRRTLTVGRANDPAEVEADRIADQVVARVQSGAVGTEPEGRIRRATGPVGDDGVIRRKGGMLKQVQGQADLLTARSALEKIRDGDYGAAMAALKTLPYKPGDKPPLMQRSKSAHKDAGLDAIEKLKEDSKAVAPKDAAAHAVTALAALDAAGTAEPKDLARITCKIAHNLMAGTTKSLLEANKKSGKGLDENLHHGTSSAILGSFTGELLSQKELAKRGITRRTGEGNSLSGSDTLKDEVFVGMGQGGGGTSAAYGLASSKLAEYNLDLLTDAQLDDEIDKIKQALAAPKLGSHPKFTDHLQEVADDYGLDFGTVGAKAGGGGFNDDVLKSELAKYEKEEQARALLPADHPRRKGADPQTGSYPILFEFRHTLTDGVSKGTSQLAEGVGKGSIDMRGQLVRAFAPFARLAEFSTALQRVFPNDHYEVIPLEAYEQLPKATGNGKVMWDTIGNIQRSQASMRALRDARIKGAAPTT